MAFFAPSSWKPNQEKIGLPRCGQCGLSKNCFSPKMKVGGTGERHILFVGEAPGEEEDRRGKHFTGETGKMLRKLVSEIGEDLEECSYTYSIICKPPSGGAEDYHIDACLPNVKRAIKKTKAKVVVLLGQLAIRSLLPTEWEKSPGAIGRWVGHQIPSEKYGVWICPIYNPSFISRMGDDEVVKLLIKKHLKEAFSLIDSPTSSPGVAALKKQVEIIQKPRLARLRMKDLAKKKGYLAFDYETTGLKPDNEKQEIVSVSFCYEGKDTFACMTSDDSTMGMVSKVLQNPNFKMVASNMKFEERWTWAKMGHGIPNWYWDTMLVAHLLDNRSQITSIKFQSYILLGIGDYDSHISSYLKSHGTTQFNRIKELDQGELLLYNGLDSLLEYLVMEKQKEIINGSGTK